MIVEGGWIASLRVAKDSMDLTCTTIDVILDDIAPNRPDSIPVR